MNNNRKKRAPPLRTPIRETVSAWLPTEPSDQFHLAITVAHTLGAIGAFIMAMRCDVLPANQKAMVPHAIQVSSWRMHANTTPGGGGANFSEVKAYLSAFPWSEDAVFSTHVWNPYLLVVAFEWLTAAFAMCNLWRWWRDVKTWTMAWITVGAGLVFLWIIRHYDWYKTPGAEFCTSMIIILVFSYALTAALCHMHLSRVESFPETNDNAGQTNFPSPTAPDYPGDDNTKQTPTVPYAPEQAGGDNGGGPGRNPEQESLVNRKVVVQGRIW
jgi:hypothetical protein